MKIDGKKIADEIYGDLKIRVNKLKEKGVVVPQIAVILIGNDPASISYITQKKKWCKFIGAKFLSLKFPISIDNDKLTKTINRLNNDPKIHGIIVQRPVPKHIDKQALIDVINPQKDIDGFCSDSPYDVPVAKAIVKVLEEVYSSSEDISSRLAITRLDYNFLNWLNGKSITVLGKGETAGGPIIKHLQKIGLNPHVITSQTVNPEIIIKASDIVVSAVGKRGVIKPEYLKKNVILLGVGMYKGVDGKLHGDYISADVKHMVSFYTPVTGGIGPVNISYLLSNLVTAAENSVIANDPDAIGRAR